MRQAKIEAAFEALSCKTKWCAKREMTEGYFDVAKERREGAREVMQAYNVTVGSAGNVKRDLTLPAPIGAKVLDRSRTFLFHSSLPGEQLGYRIKVPVVRTFTVTNQPKLSRSHTNSTDLTSRLPDGRSTRDHRKIAAYEQTLKRSAPRAPVLYHRPIGRCFTTGWVRTESAKLLLVQR